MGPKKIGVGILVGGLLVANSFTPAEDRPVLAPDPDHTEVPIYAVPSRSTSDMSALSTSARSLDISEYGLLDQR